jgi:cytochrome c553
MKQALTVWGALAAVALAVPALSRDYAAGEALANAKCLVCHGEAGNKPIAPDYPLLGGQYFDYLTHTLHAYKSGHRNNPLMSPQVQALSEQDIRNLSWYFSKQPGLQSR